MSSRDLYWATSKNDVEKCREFIKNGANVNYMNESEWTSLMCAADLGYENCVALLLQNKADCNKIRLKNNTALMYAVESKNSNIIQMLLAAGADCKVCQWDGKNVLHIAIINKDVERAHILLDHDVSLIKACLNSREGGHSAYHLAVINKDMDMINLLLSFDMSPLKIPNADGLTPAQLAKSMKNEEMESVLIFSKNFEEVNVPEKWMGTEKDGNAYIPPASFRQRWNETTNILNNNKIPLHHSTVTSSSSRSSSRPSSSSDDSVYDAFDKEVKNINKKNIITGEDMKVYSNSSNNNKKNKNTVRNIITGQPITIKAENK